MWAALTLWVLGYPDQALQKKQEALTLVRELAHPYSQAWALAFGAWLHCFRREGQVIHELAEAQIVLCQEQGFGPWETWGIMWRGWSLAEQGQKEEGMAQLRQGFAAFLDHRFQVWRPSILGLLAEA